LRGQGQQRSLRAQYLREIDHAKFTAVQLGNEFGENIGHMRSFFSKARAERGKSYRLFNYSNPITGREMLPALPGLNSPA
jgi:hypothetical protein